MQVTHTQDYVTHAVIGGAKAIDFGISDSAEFFNILSSTLYSDQKLAVVRETLCNAWDAHIEAQIEHKAVQITLTREDLIIRDFGHGIAKALIGAVYGIYGGSRKKLNGKVTGGFGLGCKAPFAYVDHFEVTSWSQGEKTIYNLSKSNAEVGGKPSIMPIVTVPTDQTGLQVKIPIQANDYMSFESLIRRIAANGEMNITLNDEKLKVIPFAKKEHNFLISSIAVIDTYQSILLRYGNVIYPVEDHADYHSEYEYVKAFLNTIFGGTGRYNSYKLVFQAEPDTISVTPSRESLSMQAHTIKTIKQLLLDFLALKNKELEAECLKTTEVAVKSVWLNNKPSSLFNPGIPGYYRANYYGYNQEQKAKSVIYNFKEVTKTYLNRAYPNFTNFTYKDFAMRIDALIESGFGNTQLIKSFKKEYLSLPKRKGYYRSSWFHKEIVAPLFLGLEAHEDLSGNRLMAYGKHPNIRREDSYRSEDSYENQFIEAKKFARRDDFKRWMPYLRNFVVLAHSRRDVVERSGSFPALKNWFGSMEESLVYMVPRTPRKIDAAREFFESKGYYVIDMTRVQSWEDTSFVKVEAVPRGEPKPKKIGVPIISCILEEDGTTINTNNYQSPDVKRIENPEFVLKFSRKNNQGTLDDMDAITTRIILELYGDKGGIVANVNQEAKYLAQGAILFKDYLRKDLIEQYTNNQNIKDYIAYDYRRYETKYLGYYERQFIPSIFQCILADQDLMDYFGIIDNRTNLDKKYMKLCSMYQSNWWTGSKDLEELEKAIPMNPIIKNLGDSLKDNKLIKFLDLDNAQSMMQFELDQNKKNLMRDTLLNFIEG